MHFKISLSVSGILSRTVVAQLVKNPPAMQETWVKSLGWEDPLEEGMATQSHIFAWRIPVEEPGGLRPVGSQRVRPDRATRHDRAHRSVWVNSLYWQLLYGP